MIVLAMEMAMRCLSNEDLLKLYGDRLMALHLQDNGGLHNQHQLPHIQYA